MSYQTSSKLSRSFWLLISARKLLCFSAQSEGRKTDGTGGWRKKKRAGGENSKRMGSARNRESNVTIGNILAFELKG